MEGQGQFVSKISRGTLQMPVWDGKRPLGLWHGRVWWWQWRWNSTRHIASTHPCTPPHTHTHSLFFFFFSLPSLFSNKGFVRLHILHKDYLASTIMHIRAYNLFSHTHMNKNKQCKQTCYHEVSKLHIHWALHTASCTSSHDSSSLSTPDVWIHQCTEDEGLSKLLRGDTSAQSACW